MTTLRRRRSERIMGAVWGGLISAVGVLMLVTFSGYSVDIELVSIVTLALLGTWLVVSALLSSRRTTPIR